MRVPAVEIVAGRGDEAASRLHVPKSAARGVSWSRSMVQTLYEGEPWTAQFDAHMSDFDPQWARTLTEQSEPIGDNLILRSRPVSQDYRGAPAVSILSPEGFDDLGLKFSGALWKVEDFRGAPVPARTVAGASLGPWEFHRAGPRRSENLLQRRVQL